MVRNPLKLSNEDIEALVKADAVPSAQIRKKNFRFRTGGGGGYGFRKFTNSMLLESKVNKREERVFSLAVKAISSNMAKRKARFDIAPIAPIRNHESIDVIKVRDATGRNLYLVTIKM